MAQINRFKIQITSLVISRWSVSAILSNLGIDVSPSNVTSLSSLPGLVDGPSRAPGPLPNENCLAPLPHGVDAQSDFASGGMSAPIFHGITIPPYYSSPMFSLQSNTMHEDYSRAGRFDAPSAAMPSLSAVNQAGQSGEVRGVSY